MVSVTTTAFGAAAVDRLGRLLDERRAGDPLGPAVVIVPKPLLAVGVRRSLGRRPGGIAGVSVVTPAGFVEQLSSRTLATAGDRPASDVDVQAAIRAELASQPGMFGRVADHRTTEERLVALHGQLAGIGQPALDRLYGASKGLARDGLRVMRAVRDRLGSARDRDHLLELALEELQRLDDGALGPIVLFLPEPTRALEGRLIAALASRSDCDVIVGLTGERSIDRRHLARLGGWSIQLASRTGGVEVVTASLLEVADPADEVAAALRDVSAHAANGVPLGRMAVLYTSADPYATILGEHLEGAGIAWCGPGRRPLSASLAGRFIHRMVSLAADGLDRAAVMALLSSAPVALGDEPVVPIRWDRLSRQAGVVDGDQWQERLGELVGYLDEEADRVDAEAMIAFIVSLEERLRPESPPSTWPGWAEWARSMLDALLPSDDRWPEIERTSRTAVLTAIDRIATLPPTSNVDLTGFSSILTAQLDRETSPGRPLDNGLLVAPIGDAAGLDLERIVVVGLAEGIYPATPRDDSLLPNRLRGESNGLLSPTDTRTDIDARNVAAALAGSRQRPLVITARGDLRSLRSRAWPRVLDGLVGERATLASHHRALADHGRPASAEDFGLRALIGHVDSGDPIETHELAMSDPVLAANLRRVNHRNRTSLNRYVGKVPAGTLDATDRLLSATALETYAGCPRSYLFGRVLRLGDDERPERIDDITPAARGTLMHAVLERFVGESLTEDAVPSPDESWSADRRVRLHEILDEEVADAQARGITGGRVNTLVLKRRMAVEVDLFIETDNQLRADRRSTPLTVEIGFGIDDDPSDVALPDGRSVRLRGRVDRVDATEDGGVLVIDYKGGSGRSFVGMDADPLDGGRRLQLPLYARVVAEKLGRDGPRTALYWLTKAGDLKPMELEPELESALDDTVSAALDGISGGLFPGVPGETVGWPRTTFMNCRYCDFDRICPTDRQREWESVRRDPGLTPVELLLSEPVGASR